MATTPQDNTPITVVREYVTPERAKELLEYNTDNRQYRDLHAQEYAQYMRSKDWHDTGDANVKFTKDMKLIDGQHTLNGIRKAKMNIWLRIAYNVPAEVFKYLDTGKKRSIGDFLKIEKFANPVVLGSAVRIILLYEAGKSPGTNKGTGDDRSIVSNTTIIDFARDNRVALKDMISDANKIKLSFQYLTAAQITFLNWIFAKRHKGMTDEFLDSLATGYGSTGEKLDKDHPIQVLRGKLVANHAKSANKYTLRDKLALCIWTWNHIRTGDKKAFTLQVSDNYTFPRAK